MRVGNVFVIGADAGPASNVSRLSLYADRSVLIRSDRPSLREPGRSAKYGHVVCNTARATRESMYALVYNLELS